MRKGIFLLEKKDADFSQKSLDILRPFFFFTCFFFFLRKDHIVQMLNPVNTCFGLVKDG